MASQPTSANTLIFNFEHQLWTQTCLSPAKPTATLSHLLVKNSLFYTAANLGKILSFMIPHHHHPPPTLLPMPTLCSIYELVFSRLNIVILKIVQIIIIKYPKPFQGSVCVSAAMQHHLLHCEASVPSQFSVVCLQLFSHSQEDIHRNKSFWKPETIINKPERNCCWIAHNFK